METVSRIGKTPFPLDFFLRFYVHRTSSQHVAFFRVHIYIFQILFLPFPGFCLIFEFFCRIQSAVDDCNLELKKKKKRKCEGQDTHACGKETRTKKKKKKIKCATEELIENK